MTSRNRSIARAGAWAVVTAVLAVGCSSDGTDGPSNDDEPVPSIDGTVVPPDGFGAPVDNLDEEENNSGIGNPDDDRDNNQPSQQEG